MGETTDTDILKKPRDDRRDIRRDIELLKELTTPLLDRNEPDKGSEKAKDEASRRLVALCSNKSYEKRDIDVDDSTSEMLKYLAKFCAEAMELKKALDKTKYNKSFKYNKSSTIREE